MKRTLIQAAVLCAVMALACMTALAADSGVRNLMIQNENVVIRPTDSSGQAIMASDGEYRNVAGFQIVRGGVTDGQAYLLLIMNDQTGVPTAENLYYIDAVDGAEQKAVFTASAKPMDAGAYEVWMTDDAQNGEVAKVASYEFFTEETPVKLGYVVNQDAKNIVVQDALYALYIAVGKTVNDTPWTAEQEQAANVDGIGNVTVSDALWILQRAVGKRNENWELVS